MDGQRVPAKGDIAGPAAWQGTSLAGVRIPRIDRFYKGATSHGSGLGLAIVRNLIVAHGGHVTAASEPGRGTTITFALPMPSAR